MGGREERGQGAFLHHAQLPAKLTPVLAQNGRARNSVATTPVHPADQWSLPVLGAAAKNGHHRQGLRGSRSKADTALAAIRCRLPASSP